MNFVVIWIEDEAWSFVDDLSDHGLASALSGFFVLCQPPVSTVNGDEDLRGDEFDEEFEFALGSVSGAMECEVGLVYEACALTVETVDDGVDAPLVSGDLACGIDEGIRFSQLDSWVFALSYFEEGGVFFALLSSVALISSS